MIFETDSQISEETYQISIEEKIYVQGGSYQALANAKSTMQKVIQELSIWAMKKSMKYLMI